jgi:hypothetical protein
MPVVLLTIVGTLAVIAAGGYVFRGEVRALLDGPAPAHEFVVETPAIAQPVVAPPPAVAVLPTPIDAAPTSTVAEAMAVDAAYAADAATDGEPDAANANPADDADYAADAAEEAANAAEAATLQAEQNTTAAQDAARRAEREREDAARRMLADGETCFARQQYGCALTSANNALLVNPGNADAMRLKARAESAQADAMDNIDLH